jgi:hypothetical protein
LEHRIELSAEGRGGGRGRDAVVVEGLPWWRVAVVKAVDAGEDEEEWWPWWTQSETEEER